MVQCVGCGQHGTVRDPSAKEWEKAFRSPARPYRWHDKSRVYIELTVPHRQQYVIPSPGGKKCECYARDGVIEPRAYERVPVEITHYDIALTAEERKDLAKWADFVKTTDLCSRMFLHFVKNYEKDAGERLLPGVLSVAKRIDEIDAKGLHCSPAIVARILWEFTDWQPIQTK
jgi:hypothetical protein